MPLKLRAVFISLLLFSTVGLCAEPAAVRSLAILPSTDTSEFNLGKPLQNAYGQLLQSTNLFKFQTSDYALPGFSKVEIAKAFATTQTDTLGFVYMEKQRVSVFLFDRLKPSSFIVTFRPITDPPQGRVTSVFIESKLREAVQELLNNYSTNQFQNLPGTQPDGQAVASNAPVDNRRLAEDARRMYRELSALEEHSYYVGADVGMARFTVAKDAASTVNFGGYAGARLSDRLYGEVGLDVFNYALMHVDGRYRLPLAEKYVSLSLSLGAARVLKSITENRGFTSKGIPSGAMSFGPGASFDIPLLGTTIRGEMRLYLGSATLFLGTYGVVFSL